MNKQANIKNKQKRKKKKEKKHTRFKNNRISVLVKVLELLLQHPVLVLVSRSSEVVSPGDWFVSSVLFFCLPVELKS
jgi:hypothetical protein